MKTIKTYELAKHSVECGDGPVEFKVQISLVQITCFRCAQHMHYCNTIAVCLVALSENASTADQDYHWAKAYRCPKCSTKLAVLFDMEPLSPEELAIYRQEEPGLFYVAEGSVVDLVF